MDYTDGTAFGRFFTRYHGMRCGHGSLLVNKTEKDESVERELYYTSIIPPDELTTKEKDAIVRLQPIPRSMLMQPNPPPCHEKLHIRHNHNSTSLSFPRPALQKSAIPLLLLHHHPARSALRGLRGVPPVARHDDLDCLLEDLVDAAHFFAAALHVSCAHLLGDGHALLLGDGGEALGLEEVDAGALGAEVGLETDEHEGGVGAEMEDFGVPLGLRVSIRNLAERRGRSGWRHTLSITFSKEFGQSIAKQTKRRSVSG